MSKFKINQFDPTLYPRKLWVVEGGTIEDIKRCFSEPETEKDFEIEQSKVDSSNALTFEAKHKESGYYGVVVWLHNRAEADFGTLTHEAIHAMHLICKACYVYTDYDNDEPQAYLGGFIGDCLWQTKTHSFRE